MKLDMGNLQIISKPLQKYFFLVNLYLSFSLCTPSVGDGLYELLFFTAEGSAAAARPPLASHSRQRRLLEAQSRKQAPKAVPQADRGQNDGRRVVAKQPQPRVQRAGNAEE